MPSSDLSETEARDEAQALLRSLLKGELSFGALLGLQAEDLERLIELGRGHLSLGRSDEARKIFEGLTALEPEVAVGHQLLAMAHEAAGESERALEAYTRAIHLMSNSTDPGLCAAYLGRGTVRLQLGDAAGAMTDLTLAREHSAGQDPLVLQTVTMMEQSCAEQLSQASE